MHEKIPRRLIQTDKSSQLPLLQAAAAASVRLHNPDFEYLFFDDRQVETFVREEFAQFKNVFDKFPIRIQKYDFFRYLAVYKYGGFYFDTDVLLARGLADLTRFGCVLPCERATRNRLLREKHRMSFDVGNYAFGATPGHPFIGEVIENCVRAQREPLWWKQMLIGMPRILHNDFTVLYTTGPGLVSRTFAEYTRVDNPVQVLFAGDIWDRDTWNRFGDYGLHLMTSSWRPQRGAIRRRLLNMVAIDLDRRAIKWAKIIKGTTRYSIASSSTD